ncbi:MAG: lycopene cyclase domain-containing protein [Chitinophagales bacterium]|nr:lycopene cyclase domain-containing protein [Chitinophagales bacterium]
MVPEKLTYVFVDLFTIIFPLLFSFTKSFDFRTHWRYYFPGNLLIALLFILWDIYYTKIGVWGFNLKYTIGVQIFNLPVEEILFFICIPYACVFTYYCFRKFIFAKMKYSFDQFWLILGIVSIVFGIFHYDKLYTSAAFISCGITLVIAYRFAKIKFLHFLLFYLIILIPFYIFNGILTGSFMNRIVVFYNNSENLGFRILTVPFEDIFYGLALLLSNILLFEFYLHKSTK